MFRTYPSSSMVYSDPGVRLTVASSDSCVQTRTPIPPTMAVNNTAYTTVRGRTHRTLPPASVS